MPAILSFFITRDFRRTPNQTDSDVTFSRSCDQGKITKKNLMVIMVEKKPGFRKKTILVFSLIRVFIFFIKETILCSLKKRKHHSELFLLHHAIPSFAELHNNNLLYLSWHSSFRLKKCTPSLFL